MGNGQCACGQKRLGNGNCAACLEDGQPLQCVGPWAKEKHNYLARYIGATWAARAKYTMPSAEYPSPGGAAYIDLFAGPGRAKIDISGEVIDGSPLIAASHEKAPFSKLILCDLDPVNVAALQARLASHQKRVTLIQGDSIENIDKIVREIPPHGLNLALIDPFGPRGLRWSVLERLGQVKRMDLLIHFPTMAIKRNFHNSIDFEGMVGSSEWRKNVRTVHDVHRLVDHLRESLGRLGYTGKRVRSMEVRNGREGILYHLVFATKVPLGDEIWSSIMTTDAHGQRSLF